MLKVKCVESLTLDGDRKPSFIEGKEYEVERYGDNYLILGDEKSNSNVVISRLDDKNFRIIF